MRANKPNINIKKLKAVPQRRLLGLIGRAAEKESTRAYLVGGPLRDILLKKKIVDVDIAVEDKVKPLGRRLSHILKGNFVFYYGFNTCTITMKSGASIDLVQTRTEVYPKPAMLPQVSESDIVSDLRRRDFTINAMAMDLSSHRFGALIDPYGGFRDLRRGLVRVLHPESFVDDPTRVFRALRFAARLGFRIEPLTKRLMAKAVHQKLISRLSGERILHELELILKESRRLKIIKQSQSILAQLGFRLPSNFFSNLSRLSAIEASPKVLLAYLFSFLHDTAKYPLTREMTKSLADLTSFSKIERDLGKATKPSEIYRLLNGLSADALTILAVTHKPALTRKINAYRNHYVQEKIGIGGDSLIQLGIPPGAVYKKILTTVLSARLDHKIRTRSDEKRLLKKLIGELC